MSINPGLEANHSHTVHDQDLAIHWGGDMPVLASPVLIGLFEETCVKATDHLLPANRSTVGVGFDLLHISPTPAGSTVQISAHLKEVKGKKLTFDVDAHDSFGLIATGVLHRSIVKTASFLDKVQAKLDQRDRGCTEEPKPVERKPGRERPA